MGKADDLKQNTPVPRLMSVEEARRRAFMRKLAQLWRKTMTTRPQSG